eukprot:2565087-Prorocentrum_lima.AAC.1
MFLFPRSVGCLHLSLSAPTFPLDAGDHLPPLETVKQRLHARPTPCSQAAYQLWICMAEQEHLGRHDIIGDDASL